MTRNALLALSTLVVLGALPAHGPTAADVEPGVRSLQVEDVVAIPVGPEPTDISNAACGECDACVAGFAFVGPDGAAYFYDLGNANLKVVDLSADPPKVTVRDGPRSFPGASQLYDGAVAPDGTVYLIADLATPRERFRIYHLSPGDSAWQQAPPLDSRSPGWSVLSGPDMVAWGVLRLVARVNGEVAVFPRDEYSHAGLVIARGGGVLEPGERVRTEPGVLLRDGGWARLDNARMTFRSPSGQVRSGYAKEEGPIDMDPDGEAYVNAPGGYDGKVLRLQKLDRSGRVIARGEAPGVPTWKSLRGRGSKIASPRGALLQFMLTKEALRIRRWRTSP